MAFAVNINGLDDRLLEFAGYNFIEENGEFKIYRNKYKEDFIVRKKDYLLYVDELDEAQTLSRGRIINLHGDA
jgi:hypothetical protein